MCTDDIYDFTCRNPDVRAADNAKNAASMSDRRANMTADEVAAANAMDAARKAKRRAS